MLDSLKMIEENYGALNKVVNKYYFPTSKFDREDLLSEAFLHTITACEAFDEEHKEACKPVSFVYQQVDRRVRRFVAKNAYDLTVGEYIQGTEELSPAVFADRLDRQVNKNGTESSINSPMTLKDLIPCSGINPEEALIATERMELLHSAINSLSELEQKVIRSTWFEDKTQVELASELGFSKQYISKVEKRSMEILSNKLRSLYD